MATVADHNKQVREQQNRFLKSSRSARLVVCVLRAVLKDQHTVRLSSGL